MGEPRFSVSLGKMGLCGSENQPKKGAEAPKETTEGDGKKTLLTDPATTSEKIVETVTDAAETVMETVEELAKELKDKIMGDDAAADESKTAEAAKAKDDASTAAQPMDGTLVENAAAPTKANCFSCM